MLMKRRRPPRPKRAAAEPPPWDERHHLCDSQNELKPPQQRQYFSRPQSLPELRSDISRRPNCKSILHKLDTDEGDKCPKCLNPYLLDSVHCRRCGTQRQQMPAQAASFLTADAGPSVCPTRHAMGAGSMVDRDGVKCPWNNRWSAGIHILNECMHPLHRSSFATKSLFETAPSQQWRRHLDVQDEFGGWRPTGTSKMPIFSALGV
ncbi:unnamed protein product [Durusdinium trenchii]|uniref:Uncharacterized protein n=2 Tax=Durusdinium trenchii TaxID=1381693 RepID=A0ABP0KL63_9DINO